MECPNCGGRPDQAAHSDGCVVGALLHCLQDRGHNLSEVDIEAIDADAFWGRFGGPAADYLASELGLPPYPEDASNETKAEVSR